ncbi:homoserine O-succinyltransferase [Aliidiomarina sedimenti]|uniref:Homoserine O-succinyltransferase n=2 Tax=Aliidiomarina sedimenti TaxID=1933879 RepID=A0ABY0C1E3_9GAMM|nr:homoserine O-succinyltransferase [Aliidiomarina sedimenti]
MLIMAVLSLFPTPPHCKPFVSPHPISGAQLKIGLLNLMPNKAETEVQWLRLLQQANSPLSLHISLLKFTNWQPQNTSALYMAQYYQNVEAVLAARQLDAVIITGAPLGQVDYNQVGYWADFTHLTCDLHLRGIPGFYSCWAANAALHHLHKVATLRSADKLSGLFPQRVEVHPLTRSLADPVRLPQSRYSKPDTSLPMPALKTLLSAEETGPTLFIDERRLDVFLLGHVEYEADTLAREYQRDQQKGMTVAMPEGYFVNNDPTQLPQADWQQAGAQLLGNWLSMLSRRLRPDLTPAQRPL